MYFVAAHFICSAIGFVCFKQLCGHLFAVVPSVQTPLSLQLLDQRWWLSALATLMPKRAHYPLAVWCMIPMQL